MKRSQTIGLESKQEGGGGCMWCGRVKLPARPLVSEATVENADIHSDVRRCQDFFYSCNVFLVTPWSQS